MCRYARFSYNLYYQVKYLIEKMSNNMNFGEFLKKNIFCIDVNYFILIALIRKSLVVLY